MLQFCGLFFVFFCTWTTVSADVVLNSTSVLIDSQNQYNSIVQKNFYSPVTFTVTSKTQLTDTVILCVQSFYPPVPQFYLKNISICDYNFNFNSKNPSVDLVLRGHIYYISLYSNTSQTVDVLAQGEFCKFYNETFNGLTCTIPETDISKIVTLKPGAKMYYRLQVNSTFSGDPSSYLKILNISVVPQNPALTNQTSIVGRFYGIPTASIYDYKTNIFFNDTFPHTGPWDFYVENLNLTSSTDLVYTISSKLDYCTKDSKSIHCHYVTPVPSDLQIIEMSNGSSLYYTYQSDDSSLTLGATTVELSPNVTIYAAYNRFPLVDNYDVAACNQLDCSKVNQLSVPGIGTPGTWYIVVRNPTTDLLTINLWFMSQCAPLCVIRGNCKSDATCDCLAMMYSGIDCATITDKFDAYFPLLIAAGGLVLLLIVVAIMSCTCQPLGGGYTAIKSSIQ